MIVIVRVAVVVVGALDGEGLDRARLELPKWQERLIHAVARAGLRTVVVLQTGNVIAAGSWIGDVDAVVEAWYPGEEGGHAIVDVLTGVVNPGGKLPITFARETGQVPNYYNMKPPAGEAGDYVDGQEHPLFPFGFGLSYTTFEIGVPTLSATEIARDGSATVSVDVRNTGKVAGDEVVQLYLRDVVSSVTRPVKELRGFRRVTLAPGASTTVKFTLGTSAFAFWDTNW